MAGVVGFGTRPARGIAALMACGFLVVSACSGSDAAPKPGTILNSSVEPSKESTAPPAPVPSATPTPVTGDAASTGIGSTNRGVPESSIGPDEWPLQVKLQGAEQGRVSLVNGGSIRLEDDLTAELYVDPLPTDTLTAWVDLYLLDNAGDPVPDAKVVIDYDMYSMAHGPFFSLADKRPDGHYIFRLDYIMFGPWGQLLHIEPKGSDQSHDLEITIIAEP